jgi:NACalpha-BTF3-like transcription factor
MRGYSKVGPKFWIGETGKKLRAAGADAQLVAVYLLTSPHANMLGLYYIPKSFIAHETGMGFEGASKGLQRAIEAGFCEYDEATEMVWVIEMATYQVADELKAKDLRVKGVQIEYDSLPANPYLARFFEKYGQQFCMSSKRGELVEKRSPFEAPSKPLRSQEQEQEQEQQQEQEQEQQQEQQAAARSTNATDLSIVMRKAGVNTQPADPRLLALAAQGVEPETAVAACEEAKRAKPNERIGAGYVFAILERWAADAAALQVSGAKQPPTRASPGFQNAAEQSRNIADRLTRRTQNAKLDGNIIDINARPAATAA